MVPNSEEMIVDPTPAAVSTAPTVRATSIPPICSLVVPLGGLSMQIKQEAQDLSTAMDVDSGASSLPAPAPESGKQKEKEILNNSFVDAAMPQLLAESTLSPPSMPAVANEGSSPIAGEVETRPQPAEAAEKSAEGSQVPQRVMDDKEAIKKNDVIKPPEIVAAEVTVQRPEQQHATVRAAEASVVKEAVKTPVLITEDAQMLEVSPSQTSSSRVKETAESDSSMKSKLQPTQEKPVTVVLVDATANEFPEEKSSQVAKVPAIANEAAANSRRHTWSTVDPFQEQKDQLEREYQIQQSQLRVQYRQQLQKRQEGHVPIELPLSKDIPSLSEAKTRAEALRITVMTRLLCDRQTRDQRINPVLEANKSIAPRQPTPIYPISITSAPTPEKLINEVLLGKESEKTLSNFWEMRPFLAQRLEKRQSAIQAKAQRLKEEYLTLHEKWLAHCAALDEQTRQGQVDTEAQVITLAPNNTGHGPTAHPHHHSQAPAVPAGPNNTTGRTTRRTTANLGDAVRSDLEMEQIIASLGNDEATDPNQLSLKNLATIPDMVSITPSFFETAFPASSVFTAGTPESSRSVSPASSSRSASGSVAHHPVTRSASAANREAAHRFDNPTEYHTPLYYSIYDDNNHLVIDPNTHYSPAATGIHDWTEPEKTIFLDKFAKYPKQFGMIAQFLPEKTQAQCVEYYYLHKKKKIDFRKVVQMYAPGKRKKRRAVVVDNNTGGDSGGGTPTGGQNGGKGSRKGKGNALLTDIAQHDAAVQQGAAASTSGRATRRRNAAAAAAAAASAAANGSSVTAPSTTSTTANVATSDPKKQRPRNSQLQGIINDVSTPVSTSASTPARTPEPHNNDISDSLAATPRGPGAGANTLESGASTPAHQTSRRGGRRRNAAIAAAQALAASSEGGGVSAVATPNVSGRATPLPSAPLISVSATGRDDEQPSVAGGDKEKSEGKKKANGKAEEDAAAEAGGDVRMLSVGSGSNSKQQQQQRQQQQQQLPEIPFQSHGPPQSQAMTPNVGYSFIYFAVHLLVSGFLPTPSSHG